MLAAQIDFDLGIYKSGTIERRVLRRMLLSDFETMGAYLDYLRERPEEQQTLVRDLLISVTSFFRDPEAYRQLQENVIEPLIDELADQSEVRIWVPGCATGEEAYSMGMLVLDVADERHKRVRLQIFATDVDQEALAVARAAVYSPSALRARSRRSGSRATSDLSTGAATAFAPVCANLVSFAGPRPEQGPALLPDEPRQLPQTC